MTDEDIVHTCHELGVKLLTIGEMDTPSSTYSVLGQGFDGVCYKVHAPGKNWVLKQFSDKAAFKREIIALSRV